MTQKGATSATMKRTFLCFTFFTLACASSVPQRVYFTLDYPLEGESSPKEYLHPVRLRLRPFTCALPYDRPQIVYRQSPYVFNYYAFKLWASKPQHMLREIVERHLRASRLVSEVEREYGEHLPDYELGAEVLAIEEYDSGDLWYAHLAMRFELLRYKDKVQIWTGHFDRKKTVHVKDPVHVVQALSTILEEEMRRLIVELDEVLARERGVEPVLRHRKPGETKPKESQTLKGAAQEEEIIAPEEVGP